MHATLFSAYSKYSLFTGMPCTLFDHNEFGTVPHKAPNNLCIVKLSFQSQAKSRQYERIIKQLIHKRSLLGCFFVRVLIECISHYNRHMVSRGKES